VTVRSARSLLANEAKKHKNNPSQGSADAVVDARRDLAAEKLAEHIRQIVATAPPLSMTQKQRLAALLWSDR